MISENIPKGTTVWNPVHGFGTYVTKSPRFSEDNCMVVKFSHNKGFLLVSRRNLTEVEDK